MSFTWTFRSTTFRRIVGGDDDARWFVATVNRTVDLIATTGTRIVDIGGTERAPLTFIALCDDATDAAALVGAIGLTGTLANPTGQSATALLVEATRLIADGLTERVRCTWEVLS
jgi:hypothetical protein